MRGGSLVSRCEDHSDDLQYSQSSKGKGAPDGLVLFDWVGIAQDWATAIALSGGLSNSNAANAQLLTQLIPTTDALNPSMPSIAEAIAVLAGCTLIISSLNAPMTHDWSHSPSILTDPEYQSFDALLTSKEYKSGGQKPWQDIFYSVLALTFLINCLCLGYFIRRFFSKDGVLITDFTEPKNTFALAINSPPSQSLAGTCGREPTREQIRSRWNIRHDRMNDQYYLINESDGTEMQEWKSPGPIPDLGFEQPSREGSPGGNHGSQPQGNTPLL